MSVRTMNKGLAQNHGLLSKTSPTRLGTKSNNTENKSSTRWAVDKR